MGKPLVSVIMAVYNGQEFLNIAVDSILLQTYHNFELIIIDDGSKDHTATIVKNYKDKRIKYFHQNNKGLAAALNFGISQAKGKYLARMDADDISYPARFEKQVQLLEKNKTIALVGTSFNIINEDGSFMGRSFHLDRPKDINYELFTRNPFGHGTVMMRRSVIERVGGYKENEPIEDYELWWRISDNHLMSNIAEELYSWRVIPNSMSHASSSKRQKPIHSLMSRVWESDKLPNISLSEIKKGLSHYSLLGDGYKEQYMYMLSTICLGSKKRGKNFYSETLKIKLLLADSKFRRILKDLEKNPLSHNYVLKNIYKD